MKLVLESCGLAIVVVATVCICTALIFATVNTIKGKKVSK